MNQENQVSLKEFNRVAGNLQSFWYSLDMKGYYLPEITCQAMTSEYLLEVLRGKVFRSEKKEILKCPPLQNTTKADLYIKIKELIQNKQLKDMGFTLADLPNKQWPISVLYALNPQDQVFINLRHSILDQLQKLDYQNSWIQLFCVPKPGFLKRTEEQRVYIVQTQTVVVQEKSVKKEI